MNEKCPACRSEKYLEHVTHPKDLEYFIARKQNAKILRCTECLSLYQAPWPSTEETNSFYTSHYQNYTKSKVPLLSALYGFTMTLAAKQFLQTFGKNNAVLDFGCGQGAFLEMLFRQGCKDLAGYDVIHPDDTLGRIKFEFYDSLISLKNSSKRYDIIRMNHVIEHLADLDEIMNLLCGLLKPGGRIVGQTPNAQHYTSYLWREYWGALHFPYHTILFSKDGLQTAAKRWQMSLVSVGPSAMPTGWAMSFENFAKKHLGSKVRGRTAFYSLLLMIGIPLAYLDRILNFFGTAIFDFELRKI